MPPRSARIALFATLFATSGCALVGGAPDADIDRRIGQLEREIAALKAEPGPAAQPAAPVPSAAASADQPAPKPADKPLLQWNVTPEITFKPGLRLQGRYVHDGGTNNNDLAVQRFRLKAAGDAWKAKYGLEFKIDGTGRTGASPSAAVENAWLDYALLPALVGRAGLYDVPFSRDALTSDSKLLFMDRSLIKDALTAYGLADNGIGVMARGRPLGGHLEYAVGAFNNDQFGGLNSGSGRKSGWAMPVGRIAVELLDPAPAGGYADYKASYVGQGRRLTIGGNAEWLGNAENRTNAGLQDQEFDVYALGTDLFFNWGPWTLQGEYDFFRQTGNVDRSNWGWFVQGGYLLEPLNKGVAEFAPWFPDLELAGRYQMVDAKSVRVAGDLPSEREQRSSIGLNAYIHDHNLKVQTELSFRQLERSADSKLYQVQLQLDF
jgi:hypothetical protein